MLYQLNSSKPVYYFVLVNAWHVYVCVHSMEADDSLSDGSDNEPPSKRGRHKITDPIKNHKKLNDTGTWSKSFK